MPTFYTIWKSTPYEPNQAQRMNMTVADATKFITLNRNSLKKGEQYFTENQTTSEVDMMFTKRDTITPNKPMWLKGTTLVSKNPKSNPQKSIDDYNNPSWATRKKQDQEQKRFEQYIRNGYTIKEAELQLKRDELYFKRMEKLAKQDKLAKSMRISNKESDKMNDTTFYRYTIGKQNEQLTDAQYKRYVKLFKDQSFKRPSKPLSKYPTAYDVINNNVKKSKPKMTNYYKVINKYDNDIDKANLTKKEADSRAKRKGSQWIVQRQTYDDPASKFLRIGKQMKRFEPKKSRGKWVGNMFRLSNARLSQLGKTGTPKQKKLAKSIIARRRKK